MEVIFCLIPIMCIISITVIAVVVGVIYGMKKNAENNKPVSRGYTDPYEEIYKQGPERIIQYLESDANEEGKYRMLLRWIDKQNKEDIPQYDLTADQENKQNQYIIYFLMGSSFSIETLGMFSYKTLHNKLEIFIPTIVTVTQELPNRATNFYWHWLNKLPTFRDERIVDALLHVLNTQISRELRNRTRNTLILMRSLKVLPYLYREFIGGNPFPQRFDPNWDVFLPSQQIQLAERIIDFLETEYVSSLHEERHLRDSKHWLYCVAGGRVLTILYQAELPDHIKDKIREVLFYRVWTGVSEDHWGIPSDTSEGLFASVWDTSGTDVMNVLTKVEYQ